MSWIAVEQLAKRFPNGSVALDGVSLAMEEGEFFTVVGPTNAGKSTLLKTIAGLVRPDSGRVILAGRDASLLEPRDRRLSLLFQNIALFPGMTGYENIAFPLRAAGRNEQEVRARVHALAEMLKVGHVLERLPQTFSGGEQQRVAIGRALAVPGHALLLDEPLTNLDARIRIALRVQFKTLHRDTGQTILYVTHDQVEAFSLSDRIAVLNSGRIEQIGSPDDIYRRPVNRFVASFMGSPPINLLKADLVQEGDVVTARGSGFAVRMERARLSGIRAGDSIALGIRPETVRVSPAKHALTPYPAEVRWVEKLGSKHILEIAAGSDIIKAVVAPDHPAAQEGPVYFGFEAGSEHVLDLANDRFVYA